MSRSASLRQALMVAAALTLASCATPPPGPPPAPPAPPPRVEPIRPPAPPPKAVKKRALPINQVAECKFKDVTGYNGNAKLDVADSKVRHFEALVNIPRRGRCHFADRDFEQVREEPHVELASKKGCKVRMWEQGRQLTVAFAECNRHCSGSAADYLWPILMDKPTGNCD